ncbi:hypothetical protein BC828DRAFT_380379 [Blastocladiella britannica]|nr:hypothetical protein BC828DRAFT_380379 [Blastocladiella britannica]
MAQPTVSSFFAAAKSSSLLAPPATKPEPAASSVSSSSPPTKRRRLLLNRQQLPTSEADEDVPPVSAAGHTMRLRNRRGPPTPTKDGAIADSLAVTPASPYRLKLALLQEQSRARAAALPVPPSPVTSSRKRPRVVLDLEQSTEEEEEKGEEEQPRKEVVQAPKEPVVLPVLPPPNRIHSALAILDSPARRTTLLPSTPVAPAPPVVATARRNEELHARYAAIAARRAERESTTLPHIADLMQAAGAAHRQGRPSLTGPRPPSTTVVTTSSSTYSASMANTTQPWLSQVSMPDSWSRFVTTVVAMDHAVADEHSALPTTALIARTVQARTRRGFDPRQTLGALAAVFPEAFVVEAVAPRMDANAGRKVATWSLAINGWWYRDVDAAEQLIDGTEMRVLLPMPSPPPTVPAARDFEFKAKDVPRRADVLRIRLIRRIAAAHAAWARDAGVTLPIVPTADVDNDDRIAAFQWHPDFNLDDLELPSDSAAVPEYLPAVAAGAAASHHSVRRMVDMYGAPLVLPTAAAAREERELEQRRTREMVESAIRAQQQQDEQAAAAQSSSAAPATAKPAAKPLTGVAKREAELLARIKLRKQQREAEAALRMTPEQSARHTMLSRMTIIMETIVLFMNRERRQVVRLAPLAQSVSDSYPGILSIPEAVAHLELLATTVPAWCSVFDVGMVRHFKLLQTSMSLAEARQRVVLVMHAMVPRPAAASLEPLVPLR